MKVLAVDVGDRYLGLAACDAPGALPQPLFTLTRRGGREDFEELAALARERGAERIVIGAPLSRTGAPTKRSEAIAAFATGLERIAGLPVELWDERHTSQEASRHLAAVGVSGEDRREREHAVAAALILESYLAAQGERTRPSASRNGAAQLTEAQREALQQVAAAAAAEGMPAWLVGGPVRDLLLGRTPSELDCVIEGDALAVAARLAAAGARQRVHSAFGTATVWLRTRLGELAVDLATARRERYPRPGALPVVEAASIEDDLRRRDFTVNALAFPLDTLDEAAMLDPTGGVADLAAQTLRTLHPASFDDDPTRIFRAVQLEVRLGFRTEAATAAQAKAAVARGALATLTGERLGAAVLRALGDGGAEVVERLDALGVWQALDWPNADQTILLLRVAEASEAFGTADAVRLRFAALVAGVPAGRRATLGAALGLERELRTVLDALSQLDELAAWLGETARTPSELAARAERLAPEIVLLAGAAGSEGARHHAERWLCDWRHITPELTGDDLQRLGIAPGPRLGAALRALRAAKLDGLVPTRAEEEAWVQRWLAEARRDA